MLSSVNKTSNLVEDKGDCSSSSIHEARYFLEIDDWTSQKRPCGASFSSPLFHLHSTDTWKLQIYQNGENQKDEGYVSVRLHLLSKPALKAKCVVFILNHKTAEEVRRPAVLLDSECVMWECARLIETEKTFDPNYGICINDCVTIGVDVNIYGAVGEKVVTDYTITETHTLGADLLRAINDTKTSDITLISKNHDLEIHCHRLILAARSPVFRSMFVSPWFTTKSLLKRSLELTTIIPSEALKEFVHFLYSDEFSSDNINHQVWIELLRAASHFKVPALQLISEKVLATHLSAQNMNDLLMLGEDTGSAYLREQASHYIDSHRLRSNSKTIIPSVSSIGKGSFDGTGGDEAPAAPPRLAHMGMPETEANGDATAHLGLQDGYPSSSTKSSPSLPVASTELGGACASCFASMSAVCAEPDPDAVTYPQGSFEVGV